MTSFQFFTLLFAITYSGAITARNLNAFILAGVYLALSVVSLWIRP